MKYDTYVLLHTIPIAVITGAAGHSVMPFTPWAGWMMYALSVLSTLLTIEALAGWPVITRYADHMHRRREGLGG